MLYIDLWSHLFNLFLIKFFWSRYYLGLHIYLRNVQIHVHFILFHKNKWSRWNFYNLNSHLTPLNYFRLTYKGNGTRSNFFMYFLYSKKKYNFQCLHVRKDFTFLLYRNKCLYLSQIYNHIFCKWYFNFSYRMETPTCILRINENKEVLLVLS